MTDKTCRTCRFWQGNRLPTHPQYAPAECRRHAPRDTSKWAMTLGEDWCGEHEPAVSDHKTYTVNPGPAMPGSLKFPPWPPKLDCLCPPDHVCMNVVCPRSPRIT